MSPVARSSEKRQGLRTPYIQISGLRPACPTKGLVDGTVYGEAAVRVRVDAKNLAEPRVAVLAVALRISAAAAVAEADVQHARRIDEHFATIVVVVRLRLEQQLPAR